MSFGRIVCKEKRKAKFDSQKIWSKVKVTGDKKTLKKWLFLSSYLNNSKSYWPILMSFSRLVYNEKKKAKFDSQKIWSKVKVTGVKKTLKKWLFLNCYLK